MDKPLKRKELDEIRPLRAGVKIKRKKVEEVKVVQPEAKVITNIDQKSIPETIQPPTPDALKIKEKFEEANRVLADVMRDYHRLLNNKVLPENKSIEEKENEKKILGALISNAELINSLSQGNMGFMNLCALMFREILSLRDAGNRVAYEVSKMKETITKLEKKLETIEGDIYEDE